MKDKPKTSFPQYFGLMTIILRKKDDREGVIRTWKEAIDAFPKNMNFRVTWPLNSLAWSG